MKRQLWLVLLACVVLSQLVLAESPTSIPVDSHFVLSAFNSTTGTVTDLGVKSLHSSVLATRKGIFGIDGGVNLSAGNDTFGSSNINRYFTNLDENLKNEILNLIGPDGIKLTPVLNAGSRFQLGILGFSGRVIGEASGYLSRDFVELLLKGNQLNRTYSLDPQLRAAFMGDAKAQVAFRIPFLSKLLPLEDLALGIGYHYIPAGLYMVADTEINFTPIYTENEAKIEREITGDLFISQTVKGSALDLGLLVRPNKKLYLAASVDGLNGVVKWSNFKHYLGEELNNMQTWEDINTRGTPVAGEVIQKLPLTTKLGVRYDLLNWLSVNSELKHTKLEDNSAWLNVTAGTDMTLLWVLPLKASLTYDSRFKQFGYNLGTGLKLLFWEVNCEGYKRPFGSGDEIGAAISTSIKF